MSEGSPWRLTSGLVVVVLSIALIGCARSASPSPNNSDQASAGKGQDSQPPKDDIRLSPTAQAQGGIEDIVIKMANRPAMVTATGTLSVNEDRTWHVSSYLLGRVVEVDARVGDVVRAGEVLARMHSHDVHDTRAAYQQAVASLNEAEAQQTLAQKALTRAQNLFRLQAISQGQLDQANADVAKAAAMVQSSAASVQRETTHLTDVLRVPVDADPKDERAELVPIESPSRGVVLERLVSAGTVVNPGSPVFTISDVSSLWLIAAVNESDVSRVRVGQKVDISVRAFPQRVFAGTTTWLGESLDPTTRTLQVRVLVPNPDGALKPEMFVTARFASATFRPAIVIPEGALQDLNGQSVVFVQTAAETFRPRVVMTGVSQGGQVEITQGLQEGERVVIKGAYGLKSEMLKSSLSEGD
jgi:cobalt-zinc-cadmium efflux system membrane fusion protein